MSLLLICTGIFFRVSNYLYDRSLWLDEAWVARDVLTRSFKEILLNDLSRVDLPAVPPAGFLLVEKLSVTAFGNSEMALRLFPFLCGVLSVILYWVLLKKWAQRPAALMALSFFVFADSLIYYSAECKQYSTEVLVAIALYLSAGYFQNKPATFARVALLSVIGTAGMFVSHTAIFILGGIGLTQAAYLLKIQERRHNAGYFFAYVSWAVGFILIYFAYLKVMVSENSPMAQFCLRASAPHFMPSFNPFLPESGKWLWESTAGFLAHPLGLAFPILALGMCLLGAITMFKTDKRKLFMLVIPVILMLAASGLNKFPFYGRFLLCLVPAAILFISEGISWIMRKGKPGFGLGLAIFFVLMWLPLENSLSNGLKPQTREEMRPLVDFLKANHLPGDVVFMNNSAQQAYWYYLAYYHLDPAPAKQGYFLDVSESNSIPLLLNTLGPQGKMFSLIHVHRKTSSKAPENISKQRTWLLLSHLITAETEQFITACLNDRGKMLLALKEPGASLYLYELHEPIGTVSEAAAHYKLID